MQKNNLLSINKIILILALICITLIASLFITHLRSQSSQITHINNDAMIFPIARDIKPFTLLSMNNKKFTQNDLLGRWTLLFFGFTHCSNICPLTLGRLAKTYNQLKVSRPNLQVVFISLDPARDTPGALTRYIHAFNKHFIGVTGKIQTIHQLESQLGIMSIPDAMTMHTKNYQLQHTTSILLMNPQGKWAGLFNTEATPEQFTKTVAHTIKLASSI